MTCLPLLPRLCHLPRGFHVTWQPLLLEHCSSSHALWSLFLPLPLVPRLKQVPQLSLPVPLPTSHLSLCFPEYLLERAGKAFPHIGLVPAVLSNQVPT